MGFVLVNVVAILAIAFVIWWFFLAKKSVSLAERNDAISVMVKDGIYTPAQIQVRSLQPVKLIFTREDPSACAEVVSFPSLNLSYPLPLRQPVEITLPPLPAGEVDFQCAMGMYRGKLLVR